jgi:hypothetical protein
MKGLPEGEGGKKREINTIRRTNRRHWKAIKGKSEGIQIQKGQAKD